MLPTGRKTCHTARPRLDLAWRRPALGALIVACSLAAILLVGRAASGRFALGAGIATDAARVAAAREKINPNTATVASLRRCPHLGPVRAQAIVAYRAGREAPAFAAPGDLERVKGIGPGTVRRIAPHLSFADESP